MKTFGKVFMRVSRMGGLYAEAVEDPKYTCQKSLHVRGWDQDRTSEITGRLIGPEGATVWEGMLYTREQLTGLFQPFVNGDSSQPKTYATRRGSLNRRATVGVLRLASEDGQTFVLQNCNAGEECKGVLTCVPFEPSLQLAVRVDNHERTYELFDGNDPAHQKRLWKLR